MIDLKEAGKNPAYALGAMLYGLQNPIETKDVRYEVDMEMFGSISEDGSVCYGCAATSALEVVTGRSLVEHGPCNIMPTLPHSLHRTCFTWLVFNTDEDQQDNFEDGIDMARRGCFDDLIGFFGHECHEEYDDDGSDLLYMTSRNWEDAVPAFEKVVDQMHKDNPQWERFTQYTSAQ